jgi:DNA repair protein RadD
MQLYDHQQELINKLKAEMVKHKSVLLCLPTGGGKTVIASFMMNGAASKGKRCYFICHRRELVYQTSVTLDELGIKHGIISAGHPSNPAPLVQVASIDTLRNRLRRVPIPDLVIWDEAHHCGAMGWQRVKDYYGNSWHVGLSATPQRLDGKGLDHIFTSMIKGKDTAWLIDNGYLSTYRAFAPSVPDTDGIKTVRGDYDQQAIEALMANKALIGDIVSHWHRYAAGKKTIGFAVSIDHSEMMAREFRAAGINAVHLDGRTPTDKRRLACRDFAAGDIQVLWNVGLFGEGFDLAKQAGADVTIEAVIMARPTQSLALYRQQVGRALRRKFTPAIILDHAGNIMRHGVPDAPIEWSLAGRPKGTKRGKQDKQLNMRRCPKCFFVHEPAPTCPNCKHTYEISGRELENYQGELQEIDREAAKLQRKTEQYNARTLDDLIKLAASRGYKNPTVWAIKVYTARQAKRGKHA